jgi:hypothetical protein
MEEGTQADGGQTGETSSPSGEKLMWKGTGRVAENEWMTGNRRVTRTKEEG